MRKMYSDDKNWTSSKWRKSFADLENDGYSFERIQTVDWFSSKEDYWRTAVQIRTYAQKVIKETEKALCFSIVNQYGNMYEMWFPKSVLISY